MLEWSKEFLACSEQTHFEQQSNSGGFWHLVIAVQLQVKKKQCPNLASICCRCVMSDVLLDIRGTGRISDIALVMLKI